MSDSRAVIATFEHADDAAHILASMWNIAMVTAPENELTAHFHHIELSCKVYYEAAGEHSSEFAESGLVDVKHGLFLAVQRGSVNMLFFYCATAKIEYCSQHRLIAKLCVTFSPHLILFQKDNIDDVASDLRDVQNAFLHSLTGKSLATKVAFRCERPNVQLDMMFNGLESNEAHALYLKPELSMLFYTYMYCVIAHLAAIKDEVHVRVLDTNTKMHEFTNWFLAMYPCDGRSFWLSHFSAMSEFVKVIYNKTFKIGWPIDAVAKGAPGALKLFEYAGLPFDYEEIKYITDAYMDKENFTASPNVPLSELFQGFSPVSVIPPTTDITPLPVIVDTMPITVGELLATPDGELTVSEASEDSEVEMLLATKPTRRKLKSEFEAAR